MTTVSEGTILWEPSDARKEQSALKAYMGWLANEYGHTFTNYDALWAWSVASIEEFWESLWRYFDLRASVPYSQVLTDRAMPPASSVSGDSGAHDSGWFPGARLNYAEQVFRKATEAQPALIFQQEGHELQEVSWGELRSQVTELAAALRAMGVRTGDRVVAYAPNIPQAIVAFLASASLGAIWSSCSPDMGAASVVDRFRQIAPKVLFAVDGYTYNGKPFDRSAVIAELQQALPTLEHLILIPYLNGDSPVATHAQPEDTANSAIVTHHWPTLLAHPDDTTTALEFTQVPFEQPLWVLYSSGTTGLPKPIVQGHGGIILEHLKSLALHLDLRPGDRFFWFTTTGWMMWNLLIGGLLVGCTVLLYDGSPAQPDLGALWSFAERSGMTFFGASAAYVASCMKGGLTPGATYDLSRLTDMGSTGSPLSVEGFGWVYEQVKPDLWLASVSGGTDVCTAFVGGCPLLPVRAGEIQCRCLGCAVHAFDEQGTPVIDQVGELVLTEPMPSMPLFFWNDSGGKRYRESYFEQYPGVWRHGDWVKITRNGSVVIYGRSDATINRQGIRMGTSEIYRVVEDIPEILDSLVVDLEYLGRPSYMPLFVVLLPGVELDDALKARINARIRAALSARYIPSDIHTIAEIPRTLSGKKLELPVKRILLGESAAKVANPDSMSNPQSIAWFVAFAAERDATS
ncbi:MAG: acetoacetate--CoA ligase [Ktedonobacterales bacterium]